MEIPLKEDILMEDFDPVCYPMTMFNGIVFKCKQQGKNYNTNYMYWNGTMFEVTRRSSSKDKRVYVLQDDYTVGNPDYPKWFDLDDNEIFQPVFIAKRSGARYVIYAYREIK